MDDRFDTMAARRWDVQDRLFSLFLVRCDGPAACDYARECVDVCHTPFAFFLSAGPLDGLLWRPIENIRL